MQSDRQEPSPDPHSLVDEAMEQIREEDRQEEVRTASNQQERSSRERRKKLAATVLVPTVVMLTVLNLLWPDWIRSVDSGSPEQVVRDNMDTVLHEVVDRIETQREESGEPPPRVPIFGELPDPPFQYQRAGDDYRLSFTVDDQVMTYDSRDASPAGSRVSAGSEGGGR